MWIATIVHAVDGLGDLDVDFALSDLADLPALISTGPGSASVVSIDVRRLTGNAVPLSDGKRKPKLQRRPLAH